MKLIESILLIILSQMAEKDEVSLERFRSVLSV